MAQREQEPALVFCLTAENKSVYKLKKTRQCDVCFSETMNKGRRLPEFKRHINVNVADMWRKQVKTEGQRSQ